MNFHTHTYTRALTTGLMPKTNEQEKENEQQLVKWKMCINLDVAKGTQEEAKQE